MRLMRLPPLLLWRFPPGLPLLVVVAAVAVCLPVLRLLLSTLFIGCGGALRGGCFRGALRGGYFRGGGVLRSSDHDELRRRGR